MSCRDATHARFKSCTSTLLESIRDTESWICIWTNNKGYIPFLWRLAPYRSGNKTSREIRKRYLLTKMNASHKSVTMISFQTRQFRLCMQIPGSRLRPAQRPPGPLCHRRRWRHRRRGGDRGRWQQEDWHDDGDRQAGRCHINSWVLMTHNGNNIWHAWLAENISSQLRILLR